MPYWESNEPFPLRGKAGVEPDPRRARMDVAVQVVDIVMPHFRLMHEMTTDHVHEETRPLANDFSTMLFETLGRVPRWRDYYMAYMAHDQTSHYEFLKTQLKAMQFLRGADDGCSSRRSTSSSCRCCTRSSRRLRHLHSLRPGTGDAVDARAAIGDYLLLAGRGDPPLGGMPGRRRCAGKPPRVSQGLTSSRKPSSERHR